MRIQARPIPQRPAYDADADVIDVPVAKPKPALVDDFTPAPVIAKPKGASVKEAVAAASPQLMEEALRQAGVDDGILVALSDQQLRSAFEQVLQGAGKLGPKTLTLEVNVSKEGPYNSESGPSSYVESEKRTFKFNVKALDKVGTLNLDKSAIVDTAKSAKLLPDDVLRETLETLGAPGGDRNLFASIAQLARTPGKHELVWHETQTVGGGDSDPGHSEILEHRVAFTSDKNGAITVGGKPLPRQNAIDLSNTIATMSFEKKKDELKAAGFPPGTVDKGSEDDIHKALVRLSEELTRPGGPQTFEAAFGGDDHRCTPHKDANGKFDGFEIEVKQKKKSAWKKFTDGVKKFIGPILTVLQFIPITAPFAAIANAALSVYNGIKNKNPLGIIAGIAGGIGGIATQLGDAALGGIANVANRVGDLANTASTVMSAIHGKNPGSFLSLIASAAGVVADGVGNTADGLADTLRGLQSGAQTGARVVNVIDAARRGDLGGVLSGGSDLLGLRPGQQPRTETTPDGDSFSEVDPDDEGPVLLNGPGVYEDPAGPEQLSGPTDEDPELLAGPTDGETVDPVAQAYAPVTHVVARGENLSRIAAAELGEANRWPEIYAWNQDKLPNGPNSLRAGVELQMPPDDFRLSRAEREQLFLDAHIPIRTLPDDGLDARDLRVRNTPEPTDRLDSTYTEHDPASETGWGDREIDPLGEPAAPGELDAHADRVLPKPPTMPPDLISAFANSIGYTKDGVATADFALRMMKAPGDVAEILALGREAILAGNDSKLRSLFTDENLGILKKLVPVHEHAGLTSMAAMFKLSAQGFDKLVIGAAVGQAAFDDTNTTTLGKAANMFFAGVAEYAGGLPKAGLFRAATFLEQTVGLGLSISSDEHTAHVGHLLESADPVRNLAGLAQNTVALAEIVSLGMFGKPGEADEAIRRIVAKNASGKNGSIAQLANLVSGSVSDAVNLYRDIYEANRDTWTTMMPAGVGLGG